MHTRGQSLQRVMAVSVIGVQHLKTYLGDRIQFGLQALCLKPEICNDLTTRIISSPGNISVKVILYSSINGLYPLTVEESALDAIQALANRHEQLDKCKDIVHLLLSLPTDGEVNLGGTSGCMGNATMRYRQLKSYAENHPTTSGNNFHDSQSNVAFAEIHAELQLYSVLNSFVEEASKLAVKTLFIVFNGHGDTDGTFVLHNGGKVSMDGILRNIQLFRQQLGDCDTSTLPYLHIIFAQCHSHQLNWKQALEYDLINDVHCLTRNMSKEKCTHNTITPGPDGKVIHVELEQHKSHTAQFLSLRQKRKYRDLENEIERLRSENRKRDLENQWLQEEVRRLREEKQKRQIQQKPNTSAGPSTSDARTRVKDDTNQDMPTANVGKLKRPATARVRRSSESSYGPRDHQRQPRRIRLISE